MNTKYIEFEQQLNSFRTDNCQIPQWASNTQEKQLLNSS